MKAFWRTMRILSAVIVSALVFFAVACDGNVPHPVVPTDSTAPAPVSPDDQPETDVPETDVPETDVPETDVPETHTPETEETETSIPETETTEPETAVTETTEIKYVEPYVAYKVLYSDDIFDENDVIQRLEKLLSEDAPRVWKGKIDRNGDGVLEDTASPDRPEPAGVIETDESGEPLPVPTVEYVYIYPEVLAYAYLDLTTGTTVSYNADEVLYSASLIKAAYIYSALMDIEAFLAQDHEYDDDGNIIYTDETRKYDLSQVWTYDAATMYKYGSGVIQDFGSGFQLTWRELFEYALIYSDNVAFDQLVKRFGYGVYYTAAWQIGIDGLSEGFMRLTANDCARVMKAIYEYLGGGSELALMMKNAMERSYNRYMIADRYEDVRVVHKYGWDNSAYHDMAVVYDEHPYVIVLMTDYEKGGGDADRFYGDVVELTKEIHAAVHPEDIEQAETEATAESETVESEPIETEISETEQTETEETCDTEETTETEE